MWSFHISLHFILVISKMNLKCFWVPFHLSYTQHKIINCVISMLWPTKKVTSSLLVLQKKIVWSLKETNLQWSLFDVRTLLVYFIRWANHTYVCLNYYISIHPIIHYLFVVGFQQKKSPSWNKSSWWMWRTLNVHILVYVVRSMHYKKGFFLSSLDIMRWKQWEASHVGVLQTNCIDIIHV